MPATDGADCRQKACSAQTERGGRRRSHPAVGEEAWADLRPGAAAPCLTRWRPRRTTWAAGRAVPVVLADPRHMAVRPQQYRGRVQFLAGVYDVVDAVRPARHREPAGPVEQQSAAGVHQPVEVAAPQREVPQAPAEQFMARAEVVADTDPGDLLDQVPVHLVEVHQLRQQPAHRLRSRLGGQQPCRGPGPCAGPC